MRASEKTRREFLSRLAGSAGLLAARTSVVSADAVPDLADVTLRIAPVKVEVAPGRTISTVGYNGSVPGPLIRFREGVTATVDLFNDTSDPEFVHWHGFDLPTEMDGAEEEGSLVVPAHGHLRYRLTPTPAGCRYVHTHAMTMSNLNRGVFTGQFAFSYIDPKQNPGRYDQEIFLATHEWEPFLTSKEEEDDSSPEREIPGRKIPSTHQHGWEVGYRRFTINGKCLGYGEPVRVREGQRVLFHFVNASATENVRLALPGHKLQVVALDGNPVPRPQLVEVVELGTAERVDAVVVMDTPGVWVLGTPLDSHRAKGMGIVVEYAGRTGRPRWAKPPGSRWDYTIFGDSRPVPQPNETIPLVIEQAEADPSGFERWSINGKSFDARNPPVRLAKGQRHRLVIDNRTEDAHPIHLHRNSFELTSVYGTPTSGVMKDVILVKSNQKVEVDVTPQMTGLTLFHCHQQLHMDYGFKMLFEVS